MVTLQPAFLACPTATLRARAQQLASLLSTRGPAPVKGSGATEGKAPSASHSASSSAAPNRLALPTRTAPAATAAAPIVAAASLPALPINNRSSRDAGDAAPDAIAATVTQQAALALIARQPALLQVPLDRLVSRCVELADILGVTPYDSCLSLTRMRPAELARMLQAALAVVKASWLGLATALAAVEQPGLYAPLIPAASADHDGAGEVGIPPGTGAGGGVSRPKAAKRKRPRLPDFFPPGAESAARQAALLCPQLLMLPPGWVHGSALHLHAALGLPPPSLRRLLARSPRLLLLPKRHREETVQALVHMLALRGPEHAARLVSQQPNLLKWTPEALDGKLSEVAAALGLSRSGVARLCRNQPALLAMSAASLAAKLRWLQIALRLPSADAARRLALRQPGLLAMSSATMKRKVQQMAQGLGLTNAFVSAVAAAANVNEGLATADEDTASERSVAAAAAPGSQTQQRRGAVLQTVLRLVVAEPTLLTMSVAALPQRLEQLAEALDAGTMHEVRAVVLGCPRLLTVQRAALQHRLRELAFGLDAPAAAIRRLVLARPSAFFTPLSELQAAVARLEATGVGDGMRGRRRVVALLEALARDPAGRELGACRRPTGPDA
ncbi:hypothetical protein PLESTM_000388600 [Pleodorina starrii]|nr:hypothetical protein PLESTM_000388600 [Pleodorina starrii]